MSLKYYDSKQKVIEHVNALAEKVEALTKEIEALKKPPETEAVGGDRDSNVIT